MGLTWKRSAGFGSTYTETGPIQTRSTSSRCTPSTYTMLHVSYISIRMGGKPGAEWGGGYLEAFSAGQSELWGGQCGCVFLTCTSIEVSREWDENADLGEVGLGGA